GVRPERLVIYGLSLGTTVAVDLAARVPHAALVVEAGLSSASEQATQVMPFLPRWLHWIGRNRFESARKLQQIRTPVLIAHGTDDEVIATDHGHRLFAAANQPKKMILVPGGSHWLPGSAGKKYIDEVAGFIKEALKKKAGQER
ncbi:MAG: alpha/beta hydrolase, partial [Blastocatellia bacterium]